MWIRCLIELQVQKIEGLEAARDRIPGLSPTERQAAHEKLVADQLQLPESLRTIDTRMQYNRLWQPAVAHSAHPRIRSLVNFALPNPMSMARANRLPPSVIGDEALDNQFVSGVWRDSSAERGRGAMSILTPSSDAMYEGSSKKEHAAHR